MSESVVIIGTYVALFFEAAGIAIIIGGFLVAASRTAGLLGRPGEAYQTMRSIFGRSVLLGLEVLVAADIVKTVAVDPSLDSLYLLGLLVLVRTFLSFALDVELEGSWPWRKRELEDHEIEANIERRGSAA